MFGTMRYTYRRTWQWAWCYRYGSIGGPRDDWTTVYCRGGLWTRKRSHGLRHCLGHWLRHRLGHRLRHWSKGSDRWLIILYRRLPWWNWWWNWWWIAATRTACWVACSWTTCRAGWRTLRRARLLGYSWLTTGSATPWLTLSRALPDSIPRYKRWCHHRSIFQLSVFL